MSNLLDHAKHLRTVHFSLVVAGLVILITVISAPESVYTRALEEADVIEKLAKEADALKQLLQSAIAHAKHNQAQKSSGPKPSPKETAIENGFFAQVNDIGLTFYFDWWKTAKHRTHPDNIPVHWSREIGLFPDFPAITNLNIALNPQKTVSLDRFHSIWEVLPKLRSFHKFVGIQMEGRTASWDHGEQPIEHICVRLNKLSLFKDPARYRQILEEKKRREIELNSQMGPYISGSGTSLDLDSGPNFFNDVANQLSLEPELPGGFREVQDSRIVTWPEKTCSQSPGVDWTGELHGPPYALEWRLNPLKLSQPARGRSYFVRLEHVEVFVNGRTELIRQYEERYLRQGKYPLRDVSFSELFPAISKLRKDLKDVGIDKLLVVPVGEAQKSGLHAFLEKLEQVTRESVNIFGIKSPAHILVAWGVPVLTIIMLYLSLHIHAFAEYRKDDKTEYPWIGLYTDPLARVVTVASALLFPLGISAWLTWGDHAGTIEGGRSQLAEGMFVATILVAGLLSKSFYKLWR